MVTVTLLASTSTGKEAQLISRVAKVLLAKFTLKCLSNVIVGDKDIFAIKPCHVNMSKLTLKCLLQ
jgi:hypothetical protein